MLNCVFWRHILLEIEFKSRVDMGSESQIAFGYCTAVSPMSGSPTFDTGKKNRNGANLKLRHTLRVGGVTTPDRSIVLFSSNLCGSVLWFELQIQFDRVAFLNCKGRLLQMIIGTNSLKQLQLSIGNDIM